MLKSEDRHVSITPLDLRQARFGSAMRGFNKAEVAAFLLETADDYEHVLRENERLRQDVVRLEASLTQFRDIEGSLKNTLVGSQKVADDMRENAKQEAARLVREAESRAAALTEKAQGRIEDVQREIEGLRLRRRDVETSIEAIISSLHHTLDFVREQERRERDDKVVPHRPRVESAIRQA
jgi:cell division initiation protein